MKHNEHRQRIALEAARILADQRYLSFDQARTRALAALGIRNRKHLPDNHEIEQALKEYQAIFLGHRQPDALRELRQQAVNAMQLLERFQPRLTGDVLRGSADHHSPVQLRLFADTPEEVIFTLMEHRIPWRESEHLVHYSKGVKERHPGLTFTAGETRIELIILPPKAIRNPPLSSLDGHPEKGVSLNELLKLVEAQDQRFDRET